MGELPAGRRGEMDYSAIFNTFMYMGYENVPRGSTFESIVQGMEKSLPEEQKAKYEILQKALEENPDIGNYRLVEPSWESGDYNSGTYACVFTDGKGSNYVVYRGTGDGEWIDNAKGMTQIQTDQQKEAVKYFEQTAAKLNWTESDNVIICGHSKGGNKAQATVLFSEKANLIDSCYSLDGQGFSPEAVQYLKETLGEGAFQDAVHKMYSLRGENDYVSGLGVAVIPEENMYFIKTGEEATDIAGHHGVEHMLSKTGRLEEAAEQGPYSKLAERVSEELMKLPAEERGECAMTIMQIAEAVEGSKVGLDGDHISMGDILGFADKGLPLILRVLLFTEEGREFLISAGGDFISEYYQKHGLKDTLLLGVMIAAAVPLVMVLGEKIQKVAAMLNRISDIYKGCKEFITDGIRSLGNWLERLRESWEEGCEKVKEWIKERMAGSCSGVFEVDLSAQGRFGQELETQYRQIERFAAELRAIRGELDFGIVTRMALSLKINRCIRQMDELSISMRRMSECLNEAEDTYRRYEQNIALIFS